jgi:Tfp pilus assembly protein PilN
MSGAAVDEVIAASATAPRLVPQAAPEDPFLRFRLQRERRNRRMMVLSAALALITLILAVVLIMVLTGQQAEEKSALAPAGQEQAAPRDLPAEPSLTN